MNEDNAISGFLAVHDRLADTHAHTSWNGHKGAQLVQLKQWTERDNNSYFPLI